MIDYMNHRLVCWAEWATRRDDGGLGWPRQSHYTKAVLSHGKGSLEEINEAAMEIETGVLALRREREGLFLVVMEFYRKSGSAEYKAMALGVHKDTMYARLHSSHVWLMNWVQDRAIEQHDRAAANKKILRAA
jgi:hypothetical protein